MESRPARSRRRPAPDPADESRRLWAAAGLVAVVLGSLLLAALLEVEPVQVNEAPPPAFPTDEPGPSPPVSRPPQPPEAAEAAEAAEGPTVASPAPVAEERSSLTERARADAERLGASPGSWTLQLMMVCDAGTLEQSLSAARDDPDLYVVAAPDQGRGCFRVFWGRYADRNAARSADVPAGLLPPGEKPWPRPVSQVIAP